MDYFNKPIEQVEKETGSSHDGLTCFEAEERLEKHGRNKLEEANKVSIISRFLSQLKDPMLIILIAAALISGITAFISDESFTDAIIIFAVVLLNAVLGVYQENKADKAIEALREMTAATCKVIRDGHQISIKSEEIVKGDVILLEAGDAVPADGRIIECASLKIEEAALTGESVPVNKTTEIIGGEGEKITLGDRRNMAYMGSTAVYGRGRLLVTATGMETEMGRIATALSEVADESTPLQKKLAKLSKTLSYLVLGICIFIFAFSLIRAGEFTGKAVLETFMTAISLAVAAIPEGLATVVTVVLSIGVTNMSKRNAVIRRLTAVETLGCAQIICSDKTGTLTQNKMTVTRTFCTDEALLATAMALCSDAEYEDGIVKGEPTEAALVYFAADKGLDKNSLKSSYPRIDEIPFDSSRKMMTTVHSSSGTFVQFTKGAPDVMIARCSHYLENGLAVPMTESKKQQILEQNKSMADSALRVLCSAQKIYDNKPENLNAETNEQDMTFIGLTGMIDPVRPEVKEAVKECKAAGIRPVMITGDHKDTAIAIALELGILDDKSQAITGMELDEISDEQLESDIIKYSVYARVQPEHKVRIVNAWRKKGNIVAMTGDGVNDAPSIKNADIGIGMGITGTDVTKNVADMVLADDNFATIVGAVEEGRRIYDNIRKSIQFLLGSNMSEVVGVFSATLIGFTLLKPVHLLWINLITDCFPALALGMEKADDDIMRRKPRPVREGIFSGGLGIDVIYQGLTVTLLTFASFLIGHYFEFGTWKFANSVIGMTMAFTTMSMAEIFHSFNLRSRRSSVFTLKSHNKVLWGAMALSFILTTLVLYVPFLSNAFGFGYIPFNYYLISIAIAILVIPVVEIVKLIQRRTKG